MRHDWSVNIQFGIPPQEKEPKDINEMRLAIDRAGLECALINRSLCHARYMGLSGEDKYTLLAYYALLELHHLHKVNMEWLMLQPLPSILVDPKSP